jgi:hypothetical protein
MLSKPFFFKAHIIFVLFHNIGKLFKKSRSLSFGFGFESAYEFIMFWHFVCFYDFAMFQEISYVYENYVLVNFLCYLCSGVVNMFQCVASKGFCFLIFSTWSCYSYFCVIGVNNIGKLF